ncbi:hypothetical protein BDZ97DRAFT_1810822 [Flammula alnicola]|nr:hypothetical protein BDZ97DRAFT_1810822 [Flammula alnicola]
MTSSVDTRSTEVESKHASALISLGSHDSMTPTASNSDGGVPPSTSPSGMFRKRLWQQGDRELARARATYFKIYLRGVFLVTLTILGVFAILWGALWKVPAYSLPGWIVDFDGGEIGQAVIEGLTSSPNSIVNWAVIPSSRFPEGVPAVVQALKDEQAWFMVTINPGSTARLESSISNPDPSYNGSAAVTAWGTEGRNENAYRDFLRAFVQTSLDTVTLNTSIQFASRLSSLPNLASLLSTSPQTVVNPVDYTLVNVLPFAQPVATAPVFSGLIFLLIMSFFVVTIAASARQESRLPMHLSFRSLITLRLLCSFLAYFFLSLCYTLLNVAFKLNVYHTFHRAGFVIFWMVTWVYMLAAGLALESLIVLLKQYTQFFMITWMISNVSINLFPLEVLPSIYRYGNAWPFYSFSKAVRTIIFGTKNKLGMHFGILIAWVALSCTTLIIIQWLSRRQEIRAMERARNLQEEKQREP